MKKSQPLFNPDVKDTYYYVDDAGMVCTLGHDDTWRDSVGRTFLAWIAYGANSLMDAIVKCTDYHDDGSFTFHRHPVKRSDDMSRDHVTYTLLAMKFHDREKLELLVKGLKWRISDKFTFTIDSWFWMKSLTGSLSYRFLFYLVSIPILIFNIIYDKIWFRLCGIGKELHHTEFTPEPNGDKSKIIQKGSLSIYPMYALHILSWQLFVMPDSIGKTIMQKLALILCGRYNYVVRILLNDKNKVTLRDLNEYDSMEGYRWGSWLNPLNRRDMKPIRPELKYANDYEKDMFRSLFIHQDNPFLDDKLV